MLPDLAGLFDRNAAIWGVELALVADAIDAFPTFSASILYRQRDRRRGPGHTDDMAVPRRGPAERGPLRDAVSSLGFRPDLACAAVRLSLARDPAGPEQGLCRFDVVHTRIGVYVTHRRVRRALVRRSQAGTVVSGDADLYRSWRQEAAWDGQAHADRLADTGQSHIGAALLSGYVLRRPDTAHARLAWEREVRSDLATLLALRGRAISPALRLHPAWRPMT